jgi:hypothetical protein
MLRHISYKLKGKGKRKKGQGGAHVEEEAPKEEDGLLSKDNGEEEGALQGEASRHNSRRSTTC